MGNATENNGEGKGDASKRDIKCFESMPNELLDQVAMNLDLGDLCNLRRVNRRINGASELAFHHRLAEGFNIYNTYMNIDSFFATLAQYPGLNIKIKSLTIVEESLKIHQYGTEWAWEALMDREQAQSTTDDKTLIHKISLAHARTVALNDHFVYSGIYRDALFAILSECVNLSTIHVRKLGSNEHIPGWCNMKSFKDLSFYKPELSFKDVFYGNWKYDPQKGRVTEIEDEFGDIVLEDGCNSDDQATFRDDLAVVVAACNCQAAIVFHD